LRAAAAIFRPIDPEIVDKHIEQERIVRRIHADSFTIQTEVNHVPSSQVRIVLVQQNRCSAK
jgi:carbamate kinase